MNALRFARLAAALAVALSVTVAHAITIDWVTVGDPGNAADTTGYGAVATSFRIMKYEFTNQQYVEFLNAVDPNGTNPNSIYNTSMGSDSRGGISFTAGNAIGTKYATRANMADKPVNYVSWFDAARVANWVHNGAQSYGSTDSSATAPQNVGAYSIGTATAGTAPAANAGATAFIPTENQWFKAAYYKAGGTNAGYWLYPTQSNTAPSMVTAGSSGIGSAGSTGNFANVNLGADWPTGATNGNVTSVGTNGGPSAYGAFDMGGNIYEWNDLSGVSAGVRGLRGGNWINDAGYLASSFRFQTATFDANDYVGFRLAALGVPEIDSAGMGSVLALVTGALGLIEHRRARR